MTSVARQDEVADRSGRRFDLVVVGASWGGLHAVGALLTDLSPGVGVAVVVALHRASHGIEGTLVQYLQGRAAVPVQEVEDKDEIVEGHVYVAPADYHLLVERGHFALSLDAPVLYSRPSIDVVLETAAEAYGERMVAVVLTGANEDGTRGAGAVRQRGGLVIVQDPDTAERREMPGAVIASGEVDEVLPLDRIAGRLNELGGDGG